MNFEAAVHYLLSLGHETLTIKLGLRNTELLLKALDNPEVQRYRDLFPGSEVRTVRNLGHKES